MYRLLATTGLAMAILGGSALAATVYEGDYEGWQAAAGLHTVLDWEDIDGPWNVGDQNLCPISPDRYAEEPGSPYITSAGGADVPYAARPSEMGDSGANYPPVSGENVMTTSSAGYGELTFTFDEPVMAVGAWFLDVEEAYLDAGFLIDGTLYRFSEAKGDASQSFLGVVLDTPVYTIQIRERSASGSDGVVTDDFCYAIPEPTALSLLAVGCLALLRRRR